MPGDFSGRNIHFGVREHAMGAIVNGLALHGFRAYGATFLTFSDYMRGAVRLSALMKLPSIWVWTHDSIGLGEDGPTHQPIEQIAALRAMPNLSVIRPADAQRDRAGVEARDELDRPPDGAGPVAPERCPRSTRRASRTTRSSAARTCCATRDGDAPDVILIGTGSEVQIALDAADALKADGIAARVVSMPCDGHFAERSQEYRDSVLPPSVRARVSVEAAATFGWHRWIGDLGEAIGMHEFGASARRRRCTSTSGSRRGRRRGGPHEPEPRAVELKGLNAMSTLADVNPQLKALTEAGVSIWLDQLGRSLVAGGELKRMVEQESRCAA